MGGELEGEAYPNWAGYDLATALDLDHGSLTLFSILLNALPFIHSIPSKSPAPARWLDVPSQSPGLGVT